MCKLCDGNGGFPAEIAAKINSDKEKQTVNVDGTYLISWHGHRLRTAKCNRGDTIQYPRGSEVTRIDPITGDPIK